MGIFNKLFSCLSTGKPKDPSQGKGTKQQRQSTDQNRVDLVPKSLELDPSQLIQTNEEQKNQAIRKGFMKETLEVNIKQNELNQSQASNMEKRKKASSSQIQSSVKHQESYDENKEGKELDKNDGMQSNLASSVKQKQKSMSEQEYLERKQTTSNNNINSNLNSSGNIQNNLNQQQQQQSKVLKDNSDSKIIAARESTSTSQTQIRTKQHKQSNITTDHGSLDSTKSTVTNNQDIANSQEEFALIDKQILYLKSLEESQRAIEEEKIIFNYINNTSTLSKNALSFVWAQQFSDHIKDKKIMNIPIDNSHIVEKDGCVKAGLKIDKDYLLVSNQVWYFLTQLYGGGPHVTFENNPEKLTKLLFSPFRLENNSNFCYMNACLQSIFSIGEMNRYFFEKKYLEYNNFNTKKKFKFSIAYYDALEKFNRSNQKQIVNPTTFKKYSSQNFDPYDQHDAQEYLRFVLGEIQDELNFHLPAKRPSEFADSESALQFYFKYHTSIVDRLFCGQLISKVQCQKCKHISSTFDPFLDLSLPIESKNLKDINSCMDNFFKPEEIDGDYKCEKCKKTSRAIKSCQLGKIPKYLVIHLKRFKMFPQKTKIKQQISYPAIFDISKYYTTTQKNESTKYALNTVIIHSGTVEYGHYVSFNKRNNENWYFCDDDNIQECELKDVLDQEAYLLFYEKI